LQAIIGGQDVPVSPRDNDVVHLDTMVIKLMPVIANVPPGALPPEGVQPLTAAMKHFADHIAAAEAKGNEVAQYKQAYKQAIAHLTAGQNTPPPPDITPAVAATGGEGGGIPSTSVAEQKMLQEQYATQNQNQNQIVSKIANPPRPVTAG